MPDNLSAAVQAQLAAVRRRLGIGSWLDPSVAERAQQLIDGALRADPSLLTDAGAPFLEYELLTAAMQDAVVRDALLRRRLTQDARDTPAGE